MSNDAKLILASQSPRRSDLLHRSGYEFTLLSLDVDEIYPDGLNPQEIAMFLADLKSQQARKDLRKNEVVLTADTIVVFENKILGKPANDIDAIRTLSELSGSKHEVITAVAIASTEKINITFASSLVHFSDLSPEEIKFYVTEFQPMDKAGSYGIQDWIGLCKIKSIEGSYSNIMGLPMELTYEMLMEYDIYPKGLRN